jgi:hypothetical protein
MKLLIIQTSPYHTASTVLVNALYGLIPECSNKSIVGIWNNEFEIDFESEFKNIIIIKCHNTNIDELIDIYNNKYKLVFICSERKEKNFLINEKYKSYDNVVVFSYDELNETHDNPLEKIVDNVYIKVKNVLPDNIELNKIKCYERIKNMNNRYEQIKNKDFAFIDHFFELHGSHRNRSNDS